MSQSRATGTRWETACVNYAHERGTEQVEREDFSSPLGDLRGWPAVIECKAEKGLSLATWFKQAAKSLSKTPWKIFVVFAKKRNAPVSQGYFITTIENGITLLQAYAEKEGFSAEVLDTAA